MRRQTFFNEAWTGLAVFDETGRYRYWLSRCWNSSRPPLNFIMLNPSTADAEHLDPTVTRCLRYAQKWGFGSLIVTNIFAWRSTKPDTLPTINDPVGSENNAYLVWAAAISALRVAAWGAHPSSIIRGPAVRTLLSRFPLSILGTTQNGSPRHPLYCPSSLMPQSYQPA